MEVMALRFLAQPEMGIHADSETFGMCERQWN